MHTTSAISLLHSFTGNDSSTTMQAGPKHDTCSAIAQFIINKLPGTPLQGYTSDLFQSCYMLGSSSLLDNLVKVLIAECNVQVDLIPAVQALNTLLGKVKEQH